MVKSLLWRLFGAGIGLVVAGLLAVLLGDSIGKALDISNFEGGRGYFVLLVVLPLFVLIGSVLGAIMIAQSWRFNLSVVAVLMLIAAGFVLTHKDAFFDPPPQVEKLGNFELLTYTSEEWGERYGLRYEGQPLQLEGKSGRYGDSNATYAVFNSMIILRDTLTSSHKAPAFILNASDPNNTSFFYLVQEVENQAKVEPLCATHSSVSADWLDNPQREESQRGLRENRRDLAIRRKEMTGGRWLLLGDDCVLDVVNLTHYPFETYPISEGSALLRDGTHAAPTSDLLPIGLSPDQHSFVRVGSDRLYDDTTGAYVGTQLYLFVFDFVHSTSYSLLVDRKTMRYGPPETIDAAWLNHHFTWQPVENGSDRLVARSDFTAWPYRGWRTRESQEMQYRLEAVKAEMLDRLAEFLENDFSAVRTETYRSDDKSYDSITFQIGDRKLGISYSGGSYSTPSVSMWLESQPGADGALIEKVANAFDQALKTRQYDDLFLSDLVSRAK